MSSISAEASSSTLVSKPAERLSRRLGSWCSECVPPAAHRLPNTPSSFQPASPSWESKYVPGDREYSSDRINARLDCKCCLFEVAFDENAGYRIRYPYIKSPYKIIMFSEFSVTGIV